MNDDLIHLTNNAKIRRPRNSSNYYKYCMVPGCGNTSVKQPDKHYILLPANNFLKHQWIEAIAQTGAISTKSERFMEKWKSALHVCEDHFDLSKDVENLKLYNLGIATRIHLKPGVVPHIFTNLKEEREDDWRIRTGLIGTPTDEIRDDKAWTQKTTPANKVAVIGPDAMKKHKKSIKKPTKKKAKIAQVEITDEPIEVVDITDQNRPSECITSAMSPNSLMSEFFGKNDFVSPVHPNSSQNTSHPMTKSVEIREIQIPSGKKQPNILSAILTDKHVGYCENLNMDTNVKSTQEIHLTQHADANISDDFDQHMGSETEEDSGFDPEDFEKTIKIKEILNSIKSIGDSDKAVIVKTLDDAILKAMTTIPSGDSGHVKSAPILNCTSKTVNFKKNKMLGLGGGHT